MKKSVLEEALADAKELKRMAIESAKLSLHESITPEIEKLLSKQLNEDLNEEEEYEDEAAKQEAGKPSVMEQISSLGLDETTLAAIKNALGEGSNEEEEQDEAAEGQDEVEESFDLDTALAEIESKEADDKEDEKEEMDESLDIDAILAEMDSEDESYEDSEEDNEEDAKHEEDEVDEAFGDKGPEAGKTAEKGKIVHAEPDTKGFTKDYIDILHKLVDDMAKSYEAGKGAEKGKDINTGKENETKGKGTEKLEEAALAKQLKGELNELKLFAGKNMYLNKVLVLPNLTEAQKAKAITAFDKVKTLDGAKTTYEVLKASITPTKRKQSITESLGFRQKTSEILIESAKKSEPIQYLPEAVEFKRRAGIKD